MNGQKLYSLYRFEFNSVFSPKWEELDEFSKLQWNNLSGHICAEITILLDDV